MYPFSNQKCSTRLLGMGEMLSDRRMLSTDVRRKEYRAIKKPQEFTIPGNIPRV